MAVNVVYYCYEFLVQNSKTIGALIDYLYVPVKEQINKKYTKIKLANY